MMTLEKSVGMTRQFLLCRDDDSFSHEDILHKGLEGVELPAFALLICTLTKSID